jgi:hypothetical protein
MLRVISAMLGIGGAPLIAEDNNSVVALFDWIRRPRSGPAASDIAWDVRVDGGLLLVESSRGDTIFHASTAGARSVRVVPLSGGSHHVRASGWQVALSRVDGDMLVGPPHPSWQQARDVAYAVSQETSLPMDELTERLFSRVGSLDL